MDQGSHPARTVRFGIFEADLAAGELRKNGVRLKIQGQPFQVLAALLEHPNELVTREELGRELWRAEAPQVKRLVYGRHRQGIGNIWRVEIGEDGFARRPVRSLHTDV